MRYYKKNEGSKCLPFYRFNFLFLDASLELAKLDKPVENKSIYTDNNFFIFLKTDLDDDLGFRQ